MIQAVIKHERCVRDVAENRLAYGLGAEDGEAESGRCGLS